MNTTKQAKRLFSIMTLVAMTSLTACGGGGDDNVVVPVGPVGVGGGCGVAPGGVLDRQVVGNFGGGATLTLQIYNLPDATIAANGRISMSNVFAYLTPITMASGPVQGMNTCLTSITPGVLGRWSSYETIEIALQGGGVTVTLGQTGVGSPTYIVNEAIEGNARVEYTGFYPQDLTMARPE